MQTVTYVSFASNSTSKTPETNYGFVEERGQFALFPDFYFQLQTNDYYLGYCPEGILNVLLFENINPKINFVFYKEEILEYEFELNVGAPNFVVSQYVNHIKYISYAESC